MSAESDIAVRPVADSDYDAVVAVWRAAGLPVRLGGRDTQPEFERQRAAFPTSFLVATHAARIVGVIFGTHDSRKGWLNRLAVHPDHRRRGIGLRLIRAAEAALLAQGITILAALTEEKNTASASLLAKAGYSDDMPVRYFRKPLHANA